MHTRLYESVCINDRFYRTCMICDRISEAKDTDMYEKVY